jgi:predicted Kef-type K+ transport protein
VIHETDLIATVAVGLSLASSAGCSPPASASPDRGYLAAGVAMGRSRPVSSPTSN